MNSITTSDDTTLVPVIRNNNSSGGGHDTAAASSIATVAVIATVGVVVTGGSSRARTEDKFVYYERHFIFIISIYCPLVSREAILSSEIYLATTRI